MAVILEFRRSEDEAARSAKPSEGSLGQIIIFPGVRIERRARRKTPRHAPTRRRVQRSRKKSS
ncbi:MAG: hypothetical protein FJX44_09375 [Alphaproteobacteria bacterium]|nr:hypothetical protein [Alphaproteobacteria bacterium]